MCFPTTCGRRRQGEICAVTSPQQCQYLGELGLALGLVWALVGTYVIVLWRRERRLERRVHRLQDEVDRLTRSGEELPSR